MCYVKLNSMDELIAIYLYLCHFRVWFENQMDESYIVPACILLLCCYSFNVRIICDMLHRTVPIDFGTIGIRRTWRWRERTALVTFNKPTVPTFRKKKKMSVFVDAPISFTLLQFEKASHKSIIVLNMNLPSNLSGTCCVQYQLLAHCFPIQLRIVVLSLHIKYYFFHHGLYKRYWYLLINHLCILSIYYHSWMVDGLSFLSHACYPFSLSIFCSAGLKASWDCLC